MSDDKAAIIGLLVKKNIENDHLRREIEFLKQRTDGRWPDMSKSYLGGQENPRATEVLRAIGEMFSRYQGGAPELEQDGISIRNSAYKLASKLEQSQRQPNLETSFGHSDIPSAIKNLNFDYATSDGLQQDKNKLLAEMEHVLKRISDPLRRSADFPARNSNISPFKDSSDHPSEREEHRTEIINGVPTRIKIYRQNVESITNIKAFHLDSPSRHPSELAAALRKIGDLEAENHMLQSRLDMQGSRGVSKAMGDVTSSLIQRDLQDWRTKAVEAEADKQSAIRELEMEQARCKGAIEEREELQKKVGRLSQKIEDLKEDLDSANRRLKEVEHKSNVDSRQTYDVRGQLDAKSREIEELREDLMRKKSLIAELEGKHKALFDENLNLKQKARELQTDFDAKKRSASELEDRLAAAERAMVARHEAEKKLNEDLAEMDSTLAILKDKLEEKQSALEGSTQREKQLKDEVGQLKQSIRELNEDINSSKGLLNKNETDALKQTQRHRDFYRNAMRREALQLGQLKDKVHELNLELKEARLMASREMIDCRRSMQAIKNLLRNKGEFCPKGTLKSLVEMKEKHNEEMPKLMVKLASYEDMINQRDSQHQSNITLRDREIESLERQIHAIREEKTRVEINRMSEQAEVENQLQKYKSQMKEIERENDTAVEENMKFRKEIKRKDREIAELKEELEGHVDKVSELKKKNQSLKTELEELQAQPRRETPSKTQDLTIRSIDERTRPTASQHLPRWTAAQGEGDCPAHVDIYIDASDKKHPRYSVETRPSAGPQARRDTRPDTDEQVAELQRQLGKAHERLHHYERQLQFGQNKGKQQQEFEARMGELDSKLSELQILIQLKDEEIERLTRQMSASKPVSAGSPGEDSDRAEVLRQRTEAMLAKVDKKLALASVNQRGTEKTNAEYLAYEVDTLKRRLQDATKRYVNEYISVCQRSLDIYEQL